MATVGEAIAATIKAQWNVGTGGTRPDPIQYLVELPDRDPNPTVVDAVFVWLPLNRDFDPIDIAEVYRNVTYDIRIFCHTKTDSARQLQIENEVDRILSSGTVITGATKQTVKGIGDVSNRSYSVDPKYISEIRVEVFTAMESSATAYGTATTTTLETDELTVNDWIELVTRVTEFSTDGTLAGDSDAALPTEKAVKTYADLRLLIADIDDTAVNGETAQPISSNWAFDHRASLADHVDLTVTAAQIEDLLMFGTANAAWVPCVFYGTSNNTQPNIVSSLVEPSDTTNKSYFFALPIPTNKGGLKLYVKDIKIDLFDADVSSYIILYRIYGVDHNSLDVVNDDPAANLQSQGSHTDPFGPDDVSAYEQINVRLDAIIGTAADLDIAAVLLHCYYA